MDEKLKQSYRREHFWLNILAWTGGIIFIIGFFMVLTWK